MSVSVRGSVCLCVCLSAKIYQKQKFKFDVSTLIRFGDISQGVKFLNANVFMVPMAVTSFSRRCDRLYTFGFVDDVIVARNR